MPERSKPQNLRADASREATASIRGYVYQVYQSVDAWMALRDDEWLYLEAAEDFDLHTPGGVLTTQVKDKPDRAVTLRSKDVIDSLEHFLLHAQRNPGVKVRFRFLTTAPRGVEAGQPLAIAGLDYWDAASRDVDLVAGLVAFLETLDLGPTTQAFLRSRDSQGILDGLVSRIAWDTDSKPIEGLTSAIKAELVVLGRAYGVIPSESEKVLAVALDHVVRMLAQGEHGPLGCADFLRLFENATMERMPKGEAAKLRAVFAQTVAEDDGVLRPPLPLPSGSLERRRAVSSIAARLSETQVVFVYGSTGLGKTALASLVGKQRGDAMWATMRSLDARATARALRSIAATLLPDAEAPNLVLDDLDLGSVDVFRNEFVRLVFSLRRTRGTLLVTSYLPAPRTLLEQLWLDDRSNLRAEYFSVEEIEELLARANAPASSRTGLAQLVRISTLGHPQLVQARIRSLSAGNFATPQADVLNQLSDEEMRKEIRRRLVNELSSRESRTLLYRLSIALGPISRRHAEVVGEVKPIIRLVVEQLDSLVGPWIEEMGGGVFRISPLVAGVGNELLDRAELRSTHAALARIPFLGQSTSPEEFAAAFFHALASEADQSMVPFAYHFQTERSIRKQPRLAAALQPILLVAADGSAPVWRTNAFLDATIRVIQFETAAVLEEFDLAVRFAQLAVEAASRVEGPGQEVVRGVTAIQILLEPKVPLPAKLTVALLVEVFRLAKRNPEFAVLVAQFQSAPRAAMRGLDVVQSLFSVEVVRIDGVAALSDLVGELNKLAKEDRDHLLAALDTSSAALLVNNSWLHDVQKSRLNASEAVQCYGRLYDAATAWGNVNLARASRLASAVVLGEYDSNQAAAVEQISLAIAEFGEADGGLLIARAKVHSAMKDYASAVADFAASEKDAGVDAVDRAFARRSYAIAQASLGQWSSAAETFASAREAARRIDTLRQMSIGLLADSGYARWKAQQRREALTSVADALTELAELPIDSNLKSRHVHATVRHLVLYFWQIGGGSVPEDLLPGLCSNQEPHPAMAEHNIVDLDGAWDLLVEVDERLGDLAGVRARRGKTPSQRMRAMEVSARMAALAGIARGTTRSLDDAPTVLIRFFEVVGLRHSWDSGTALSREPIPKLDAEFWTQEQQTALAALVVGLGIVSVARSLPMRFASWRRQFAELGVLSSAISVTLEAMERGSDLQEVGDATVRAARAIGILQNRNLQLRDVFACHFALLNLLTSADAAGLAGEAMGELVLVWREVALERRAELVDPRLNCVQILKACDDSQRRGRNKAASVLLAVAPAVGVHFKADAQRMLENLRDSPQLELT